MTEVLPSHRSAKPGAPQVVAHRHPARPGPEKPKKMCTKGLSMELAGRDLKSEKTGAAP